MNRFPTIHLQIIESAMGKPCATWPTVMTFPQQCQDPVFALPQPTMPVTQPTILVITLDLAQLAEWLKPTIH